MASSNLSVTVDVVLTPEARRVLDLATTWQGNCPACGHRYNAIDRDCPFCGSQLPAPEPIAIDPNPYFIPPETIRVECPDPNSPLAFRDFGPQAASNATAAFTTANTAFVRYGPQAGGIQPSEIQPFDYFERTMRSWLGG